MAFGKPVLCSKYAGSREMVMPGENGFIFDPFDATELADYMTKFIGEPSLAARFGARSLEKMARFTPRVAAEVLTSVALQTIKRPRRWRAEAGRRATSAAAH